MRSSAFKSGILIKCFKNSWRIPLIIYFVSLLDRLSKKKHFFNKFEWKWNYIRIMTEFLSKKQMTFLTKIQNRISEKNRKKIVLLSWKKFVKTQFLGVVEFPSIFLILKIQGSGFSFQFLKNYHNLTIFLTWFWILLRNVINSISETPVQIVKKWL